MRAGNVSVLGLLIGTDDGLLELIPGDQPRNGFHGAAVTTIDYRDGIALAGARGAGAWVHDGRAWRSTFDGDVRCARIGPDGTLYLGLTPAGLTRSRDGGESWEEMEGVQNVIRHHREARATMGSVASSVSGVLFTEEGMLIGIAGAGAWFTRDDGVTWLRRSDGLDSDMHRMWEHPERPDRVYASTASGFYRSDDGGFSWVQSLSGLDRSRAGDVAVLPGSPDRLVLACARRASGESGALFSSANAGVSWTRVYLNEQDEFGDFDHAPLVARVWDSIDTLFVLADGAVFGSHDAGRTWIELASGLPRAHALAAAL